MSITGPIGPIRSTPAACRPAVPPGIVRKNPGACVKLHNGRRDHGRRRGASGPALALTSRGGTGTGIAFKFTLPDGIGGH